MLTRKESRMFNIKPNQKYMERKIESRAIMDTKNELD
jgi:hypothetical protein